MVYSLAVLGSASVAVIVLLIIGLALAGTLEALRYRGLSDPLAAVLAWAPLHLLLLATGGLTSPLLPLAAAWVVASAIFWRGGAIWGGLAALTLLALGEWRAAGTVGTHDGLRAVILLSLAAVAPRFLRRAPTGPAAAPPKPHRESLPAPSLVGLREPDLLQRTLELVRRAADATEVILWERGSDESALRPLAWATPASVAAPATVPQLDGHPYGWALLEQVPIHLQHGRKPLPREGAAEMLLLPLSDATRLLVLGYANATPPDAERTALTAGAVLSELVRLLEVGAEARHARARLSAFASAAFSLPAELRKERLASHLARTTRDLVGADGAAIALWDADSARGSVIASSTSGAPPVQEDAGFGPAESRVGLACKHGTALSYADLRRDLRTLPLCSADEIWPLPPRSALVQPFEVEGRILGAAIAWHAQPNHFSEEDARSLQLLCSVAAPRLQGVLDYEALDRRAATDPLTGLPNRGAFNVRFATVCTHFQRYGRAFSVIVLDVDFFKKFNDTWGHETGDEVLRHVAGIVRSSIREVDLGARLGGEEFAILLPETSLEQALTVAERIRHGLEISPVHARGRQLFVTASLGVASCPSTCPIATEAPAAADAALYHAKETGRNRVSATPRGGG